MKIENIADLHILVQTASYGSLTAAATTMGITPAAASATLKRLENQLGVRLFERSTRAMRITTQGQILLDYAKRAFDLLAEGEAHVSCDSSALVGTLRVAAPSDLARNTLLPWFNEFLELHPGLQLALSVGDKILDLMRDEVDLALRYGTLADSRLVARTIAVSRPILCASPGYLQRHTAPKIPQDLLQHNCITFERAGKQHRLWRFAQNGIWTEVTVSGDRYVDDASLAREWAVADAGILLKSMIDIRRELENGTLVPLLQDWDTAPYPLHALLPSGRFVPGRVRALIDFLAEKFASNSAR